MTNKEIYDKFDYNLHNMVVFSTAASINANVEYIYPESLIIGILLLGNNSVSKALIKQDIDLNECLDFFKKSLSKKSNNNQKVTCEKVKPCKEVVQICKKASIIAQEWNSEKIKIDHIFIALIEDNESVRKGFQQFKLNETDIKKTLKNDKYKNDKKTNSGSALETFCINMNNMAKNNEYDPILARDEEIEEAITVLCRRNKSNPILVGEAGVGKSAIVEGICQRIASGTVPKKIKNCVIYSLNMMNVLAGSKYRGDFEKKMKNIVDELSENSNYILFIDEIHTIIGAGASSGAVDAANILKPHLARGLKCIGATTNAEYKKVFSKDSALDRRFEKINVDEPDYEKTILILNGIRHKLQNYHNCTITDEAIDTAVKLSIRYINNRNLPDKAIDCLDIACARYAWKEEENPQILGQDIAMVISKQSKIPLEIILSDNYQKIMKIETSLREKIIGQDHVINSICRSLTNYYSGIQNPNKPVGSFVMGGESGTGKTYLSKCLAELLFNNEHSFVRVDMSEYSEKHSVSKIIGSPPGYVGFDDATTLADRINNKPYCILLLDEIEKAHPAVLKIFLQVMSDGNFTNSNNQKINCKNLILIMTGNFGMNEKEKKSLGFNSKEEKIEKAEKNRLIAYCKEKFGEEFVNRIDDFLAFNPLREDNLKIIACKELQKLIKRINKPNCKITFEMTLCDKIVEISKSSHGKNANMINRIISKNIEPSLADVFIKLEKDSFYNIELDFKDDKFICRRTKKRTTKSKK